jgi:hypothetical protein
MGMYMEPMIKPCTLEDYGCSEQGLGVWFPLLADPHVQPFCTIL